MNLWAGGWVAQNGNLDLNSASLEIFSWRSDMFFSQFITNCQKMLGHANVATGVRANVATGVRAMQMLPHAKHCTTLASTWGWEQNPCMS